MPHLSLFLLLLLFLSACECEDLVPTEEFIVPSTFQVIRASANGELDGDTFFASFDFNSVLESNSVEVGSSVIVTGDVEGEVGAFVGNDGSTLFVQVFTGSCMNGDCGKSLTFRLVGTGDFPLRDLDGRILDGDYDNSRGGDFVVSLDY